MSEYNVHLKDGRIVELEPKHIKVSNVEQLSFIMINRQLLISLLTDQRLLQCLIMLTIRISKKSNLRLVMGL